MNDNLQKLDGDELFALASAIWTPAGSRTLLKQKQVIRGRIENVAVPGGRMLANVLARTRLRQRPPVQPDKKR